MNRPSMHHHTARFRGPKDRVGLNTALSSAMDDIRRLKESIQVLRLRQAAMLEYHLSGTTGDFPIEVFESSETSFIPTGTKTMISAIRDLDITRRSELT